jgi:hypothetical protein
VHENEQAATPAADGTDEWRDWNIWADARADARIELALDVFAGLVGDEMGAACRELRGEVNAALAKRDEQIAELRGKLDMLTSLLTKGTSADVVPLPGGRRHA